MARVFVAVLSLLSLGPCFPAAATEPLPESIPATVLRVIDGDTIEVAAHVWLGIEVTARVRLKGIDAPELNAPCAEGRAKARAALALVRRIVGGGQEARTGAARTGTEKGQEARTGAARTGTDKQVLLGGIEPGKYARRVVARVTAGAADIAQALLAANLARPYDGGKRQSWCGE